jgi:hypothetical protein
MLTVNSYTKLPNSNQFSKSFFKTPKNKQETTFLPLTYNRERTPTKAVINKIIENRGLNVLALNTEYNEISQIRDTEEYRKKMREFHKINLGVEWIAFEGDRKIKYDYQTFFIPKCSGLLRAGT